MRTATATLVFVLSALGMVAQAEDADRDARIKAFVERCEKERVVALKEAREQLPKARAFLNSERRWKAPRDASSQHQKKMRVESAEQAVDDLEKRVKQLEANDPPYIAPIDDPHVLWDFRIGDIGSPGVASPLVTQIVDESNMILTFGPQTYWLTGVKTKGLVDGDQIRIRLPDCIEVTGTKKYTTVLGGSKTVFVLAPFDTTAHLKPGVVKKPPAKPKAAKPKEPAVLPR